MLRLIRPMRIIRFRPQILRSFSDLHKFPNKGFTVKEFPNKGLTVDDFSQRKPEKITCVFYKEENINEKLRIACLNNDIKMIKQIISDPEFNLEKGKKYIIEWAFFEVHVKNSDNIEVLRLIAQHLENKKLKQK